MMLSRMRAKAARMLWPATASPGSPYYVGKYLRQDIGTAAQLEAGLRDHAQSFMRTPKLPARDGDHSLWLQMVKIFAEGLSRIKIVFT